MLNKTIRFFLFAGVAVLAFIGFINIILFLFKGTIDSGKPRGIIVQDSTQAGPYDEHQTGKQTSNIQYSFPVKIYNSSNSFFKVLLVEPRVSELFKRAGYSMSSEYENGIIVNYVFMNSKSQDLSLLFSRPAFIQSFSYPSGRNDSEQTKILYNAIIHDSNSDGLISSDDNVVLFSSEIDGTDLTQITHDTLSLNRWEFADHFQSVIIEVKQPLRDKSIDENLWPRHLYWYELNTKKFKYQKLGVLLEQSKKILGR